MNELVVEELSSYNWSAMRDANGVAANIPNAFLNLLGSNDSSLAKAAYWELENSVVLQGSLFECALFLIKPISIALQDFERPRFIRIALMELLFQIVNGESHFEEVRRGHSKLGQQCREMTVKVCLEVLDRIVEQGELAVNAREIIDRATAPADS